MCTEKIHFSSFRTDRHIQDVPSMPLRQKTNTISEKKYRQRSLKNAHTKNNFDSSIYPQLGSNRTTQRLVFLGMHVVPAKESKTDGSTDRQAGKVNSM